MCISQDNPTFIRCRLPEMSKLEQKIIKHRKYKDFSNNRFREVPINELSKITFDKNNEGLKR